MVISKPMRDSETYKSRAIGLINPTANISKVTYTKAAKLMAVKGTMGKRDSRDSAAARLDMRKLLPFSRRHQGDKTGVQISINSRPLTSARLAGERLLDRDVSNLTFLSGCDEGRHRKAQVNTPVKRTTAHRETMDAMSSAKNWLEGARPHTWANAFAPLLAGTGAAAAV